MSDRKSIRFFYLSNVISSCLGGIGGLLMLILLPQQQYGLYVLFTTFVLQFMILSFGYPDGILIDYRDDNGNININDVNQDLHFFLKFEFYIVLFCLLIFNTVNILFMHLDQDLTVVINMALATIFPANIIETFRAFYISLKDFKNISFIDIFNKSYLVLMVIPIMLFWNKPYMIYMFMLFDIICRGAFSLYLYSNYKKNYMPKLSQKPQYQHKINVKRHFKTGLYLLIGNWLVIMIYSLDKMFLSNNDNALGIYTQALFFFGIIYQLIMPFKDVIFVKINEKISHQELFLLAINMMVGIFFIITIFCYIVIPGGMSLCHMLVGTDNLPQLVYIIGNKFLEYEHALSLSQILVVLVPTYITVQLILDNLLMIKMQSRYAKKTLFNFVIVFMIYVALVNIIPDQLHAVMLATVIVSIVLFFINLSAVTNFGYGLFGLVIMIIIVTSYYYGLSHWLVALILTIILFISFIAVRKRVEQAQLQR